MCYSECTFRVYCIRFKIINGYFRCTKPILATDKHSESEFNGNTDRGIIDESHPTEAHEVSNLTHSDSNPSETHEATTSVNHQ